MDIYKTIITDLYNDLQDVVVTSKSQIQNMPSGNLRCYKKHGRMVFQHAERSNGRTTLHEINRNSELIAQLARKEFLQKLHDTAAWDAELLESLMYRYRSLDPEDIVEGMSRAVKNLPDLSYLQKGKTLRNILPENTRSDSFLSTAIQTVDTSAARMEAHRKWALEEYEQSTYKPEEKIHLTSSGVYVRSKSEALISEKLFDRDVPNRYEQIIRLEGKKYAPDFTFRDFRGDWFFWEHAGKMNEVKYVRRHLKKMSVYERCGIVPWKNLIVTYDTLDGGINMAFIDSIIRYQVLPRL